MHLPSVAREAHLAHQLLRQVLHLQPEFGVLLLRPVHGPQLGAQQPVLGRQLPRGFFKRQAGEVCILRVRCSRARAQLLCTTPESRSELALGDRDDLSQYELRIQK